PASMWHYRQFLPIVDARNVVSLSEGATRLVDVPRLAAGLGARQLMLKNEMQNPSGSFKDRQVSVGISHARELGKDTVAVVSSGNVAAATAAYAARAGMRAILFMHGQAGAGKMAQAAAYGATVIRVDSPSPSVVFDLCIEACARWGWYHLSTAGMYEPYNVEGAKTIAYELFQQYQGELPEWIVAPVGGGGLLGGIWRGFLDLQRLGLVNWIPRLCGVQAAGCAPLKQAMDEDTPFLETLRHPWPNPKTVAGGIADDILFDGHTVLPAIRQTEGAAIAVSDEAIIAGVHRLAREEGLLCELTSGVVIAALEQLPVGPEERVCCILTGNGIKDLQHPALKPAETPLIPASIEALAEIMKGLL
ncbi:MAG: threonine synthase, partial [Candidatus Hydrogenedentes bacterium]|nr:threonine synthase [Candidatus Hydrogenedentota bacterium]